MKKKIKNDKVYTSYIHFSFIALNFFSLINLLLAIERCKIWLITLSSVAFICTIFCYYKTIKTRKKFIFFQLEHEKKLMAMLLISEALFNMKENDRSEEIPGRETHE